MFLKSLAYKERENTPQYWNLKGFELEKINLIVGTNATGKTRTLNIIGNLANLFAGEIKFTFISGNYEIRFSEDNQIVSYSLGYENNKIFKEELYIGEKPLLRLGVGGAGTIWAEKLNDYIEFQTPETELACFARRDSVQHSFFDKLYTWGKNVRYFYFGSPLGKDHLIIPLINSKESNLNIKRTEDAVAFFKKGIEKHGNIFTNLVKDGMQVLGYNLEEIKIGSIPGIVAQNFPVTPMVGLLVKERDIRHIITQLDMSQGMFRALSLIIQLSYAELEKVSGTILIDDIGEGLDFQRSSSLVKLLIEKAEKSNIQLIMSTNDRFIMNNVPLQYWSVIKRDKENCSIFNYSNSKAIFDDFQFTGLNNFDFLSTEFYLKGFDDK